MLDNVKSKYIQKEIFDKIQNKRKLNIIKYNKRIKVKLNINKEDFEIYTYLKEFNNKYKTNIEDIDIRELNLSGKYIENEGLKDLSKIKFKELKELDLSYNKISDISVLEKVNFKELKELYLSSNEISDINVLEKVNFKVTL
jgi:Leucine-rich repeat (LRR) protein